MSNLIKQTYVVNSNTEKRVINSNSLIKEKLSASSGGGMRFAAFEPEEEYNDGEEASEFQAGLSAEMVEVEPEPEPSISEEEILMNANQEAEEILLNARREAEAIRVQANEEAEIIKQNAKKAGYEEGSVEKEQYLAEREQQIEAIIQEQLEELENDYSKKYSVMERDIVTAITAVIENVFHVQFHEKKEILLQLIQKTIMNVEVGKSFRIRVSENNRQFVEERVEVLRSQVGSDVQIEVSLDASLDDSSCLVDTDFGVFDCGIDTQMKNLLNEIKRLSN